MGWIVVQQVSSLVVTWQFLGAIQDEVARQVFFVVMLA